MLFTPCIICGLFEAIRAEPFEVDILLGYLKLVETINGNLVDVHLEVVNRSAGFALEMAMAGKGDIKALLCLINIHHLYQSRFDKRMERVVNGDFG
jgi:hypothetical protein